MESVLPPGFKVQPPDGVSEALLHSCCAPCAAPLMERICESGIRLTIYFYNPNIHPQKEYLLRKDENIRWEFWDNGEGIEPKMLKDIFLPSVTTRGSTEGRGVGLFRARKIIEWHGGRVWAESEGKGKGATMVAEMPAMKGEPKDYWGEKGPPKPGPRKMF